MKKRTTPVHYAKDQNGKLVRIPIREIRPGYYLVDYRREGKTERKGFAELTRAENHARALAIERRNLGLAAFALTDDQRHDALKALGVLAGSASLLQAATEYIRRHPAKKAETLTTTAARYLRAMRREGARRISVKDKLWKFKCFIRGMGSDCQTASVDAEDIERWMDEQGHTNSWTRRGYRGAIGALLNFYRGTRKTRHKRDEVLPTIWSPVEVAHFMQTAAVEAPAVIPALAILFFAGLRPHEVFRLDWRNVRLAEKLIMVDPETSKVRTARAVDIPNNLLKWLAQHERKTGLVSGGQFVFRRLREKVMKKAGVPVWPVDVARHSFATAHYVQHGDAARTMQQLGHFGSVSTFTRHYKGLMTPKEAAAYWKVEPKQGKILRLARTA